MNNLSARDILEKLKRKEELFIINDDINITKEVKNIICQTDWDEIKLKNMTENKKDIEKSEKIIFENVNETGYLFYINRMNHYKDITSQLPEKTRFLFLKKLIIRIMMVVERYQVIFNEAVCALFDQIFHRNMINEKNINQLKNNIEFINKENLNCQNSISDLQNYIKINEEKFENIYNEIQNYNEKFEKNIKNRLEENNLLYQSQLNFIVSRLEEKINQIDQEIHQVKKEVNQTNQNYIEQINRDLIEAKDDIWNKVREIDNWQNVLSEQQKGLEKWVQLESEKTRGLDKWLNSTNRRIDSCNELLSASPDTTCNSYSQAGEDVIAANILLNMRNKVDQISYLDIGANHYKNFNNTFRFYQKGYSGVLVEANPTLINELKKYRSRDTILNYGIGVTSNKKLDFYVTNGGGLSSFNKNFIDQSISHDNDVYVEKIMQVSIITFNEVMEQYFENTPTIVSIDIEGDEYNILSSINYQKYRPIIFIVETVEYQKYTALKNKRDDIIKLMKNNDYEEYAFTGINSIFIDKFSL